MTKSHQRSDLQIALDACKQSFIAAGAFSLFINLLMLVPSLYMLQVYDRVVTTGSHVTLLMLTLVTTFLFLVMGSLEWVRSQILIRSGAKLDLALNQRLFDAVFKQCLLLGGKAGSSQPLADLLNLRQFLTGPGLAAFSMRPGCPSTWRCCLCSTRVLVFRPLLRGGAGRIDHPDGKADPGRAGPGQSCFHRGHPIRHEKSS